LLLQLLQALDYLHHRSVIHRDLKPANVLVDGNNTVKVLDFGLALATDIVRQQQDKRSISGTLAYIAPEVLIGNPVSRASDMYAFGVIMYEVLKGDHPYDRSDTNKLIFGIVNEIPDTSEFDAPLASLLNRLLAKDPDDRFTDIRLVIERLCEAVGITPPTETLAIRESYLQASAFVGRDEEITELENLLQALTTTGAIRLIAGESGVGKSRLLNELRVRALVENINVVRGQAVSEGSAPFKIWRDVLRFILLYTEIDDREARILKYIMPRIDDVLGYEVGDVPQELRPQTLQLQLIEIISNLLKRQSKPIVLMLEDLHWADQASIELIVTLSRNISEYPVLLLGSYRSDEMPDLPQRISSAPIMTLSRLTAEEITQLSSRMLGNVTLNDEITAFLQRETAGNIFFVIEILRLWAQEAGDLRTIAQSPIPDTLVAGGILAVLRQRVERLDTDAQQVLMYAAVFGREIDQIVLEAIDAEANIDDWLQDASAVAIIEVVDDRWRFVHDKLREYLLHELQQDTTQWRKHHRIVAEALETRYANDDLYIPSIAYHYHEARIANKAVIYLEQAGELVRASDYQQSVNYLEALLSYDDILASYPKMQRAKFHAMLSTEHHLLGNSETAEYHLLQFLHHSDTPTIPTNNIQAGLSILRQVGQQTLHRLLPTVFVGTQNRSDFSHHMYIALMNSASVYT
ncbi:MAG: AAA family ATPase, partial [Chloroflexota bacterium]